MKNILFAYIFILFEFMIPLGEGSLELLPTWVGYLFLVKGFKELSDKSESIKKSIPMLEGMVVIAAIMWVLDIIAVETIPKLQSVFDILLRLYYYSSTYTVMQGISEIEEYHHTDLGAKKVKTAWWIFFAVKMLSIISRVNIVSYLVVSLIKFLVSVYNIVVLNKTRKAYNNLPKGEVKNSLKMRAMINGE